MQTNVLEYLENTVDRVPDKTAFADEESALSFIQVSEQAKSIGTELSRQGAYREPVVVYMKKCPQTIAAFFGVIYAGCYYVPIDEEMPRRRMQLILENTDANYLIYDESTKDKIAALGFEGTALPYETCSKTEMDEEVLAKIREGALDIDAIYVLFTSGSTGVPKGVVGYHRGVIDYIESLSEVLGFNESTVFGNQTPLYLDACMKEIYPTLKYGATTWLIPKSCFMFPVKLVEILKRLSEGGNTVVVIEHNLDVIKTADYIIDIGPEGGDKGGTVVAQGTPEEVAQSPVSYTGKYVKKYLK